MSLSSLYDNSSHPDAQLASADTRAATQKTTDEAVKSAAQANESKLARLYDTMPQGERKDEQQPAQKTDADRAAVLYSPDSTYADTILVTDVPADHTPEQVAAANADARAQFAAMELPGVLARTLTDRFTAAMRAPIDEATYERRMATLKTDLASRFGGIEHVEERLADVRKLLAMADPAVVDALVESGLSVDPDTIASLAEHARSLKGRGRLR